MGKQSVKIVNILPQQLQELVKAMKSDFVAFSVDMKETRCHL